MSNPNGRASSGASEPAAPLVVIGCGNLVRGDDGAGVEVVRALGQRHPALGADRLIDAGTAGMEVMFRVRGAKRVVIVDACRSGHEAGAIFRLPAREAMTPTEHGYTLHGLRWDHALYAGSRIYGDAFVDQAEVILIEARDTGYGLALSPPVQDAVARVTGLLDALLDEDAGR